MFELIYSNPILETVTSILILSQNSKINAKIFLSFNNFLNFNPLFDAHSIIFITFGNFTSSKFEEKVEILRLLNKTLFYNDNLIDEIHNGMFHILADLVLDGCIFAFIIAFLHKTRKSPSFPMNLYDARKDEFDQYLQNIGCSIPLDDFLKFDELPNPESDMFSLFGVDD